MWHLTNIFCIRFSLLINFVEDETQESWKGYLYAFILTITAVIQTLVLGQYFQRMFIIGMQIRTSIVSSVYRKVLEINIAQKPYSFYNATFLALGYQNFEQCSKRINSRRNCKPYVSRCTAIHGSHHLPQYALVCSIADWISYLLFVQHIGYYDSSLIFFLFNSIVYIILGPSVFAGLGVMILLIPVNGVLANATKKLQIKQMKYKDKRVKMMNEILSGIKVIHL